MHSDDQWANLIAHHIDLVNTLPNVEYTSPPSIATTIDHTLLKPDVTVDQINTLCDEAIKHSFKSCCVNGVHVERVSQRLVGSSVLTCCVVGFPLGASASEVKTFEAKSAISSGAHEIDMVFSLSLLKSRLYGALYADVRAVVEASAPAPVKVILETALLNPDEIIAGCFVAAEAGAAFVKTSTGFASSGAKVGDVALMKKAVSHKNGAVQIKASGGIKDRQTCLRMLEAGADRIGTSSGVNIVLST